MSQNDFSLNNADGATFRADVNAALQALATLSSGASAPSTTYPYMLWADTTNDLLKQRNAANSAWITKGTLSAEYGGLPASGISYAPGSPALLNATNVQEAIDELMALSGPVSGTPVAATSGTAVNITDIPSNVKRVTVTFIGVSTNGSANLLLQFGSSSGIQSTGYISVASYIQNSTAITAVSSTAGFVITGAFAAAEEVYGQIVLTLHDAATNSWVVSGTLVDTASTTNLNHSGGARSLPGALDRIRITTTNGTDTFDGVGSVNILYETGR